jgi:hypothetical protein
MEVYVRQLFRSKRVVPPIAVLFILVGIFFATRYATRALDTYREVTFVRQHDFDAGNLEVDILKPWMNIQFIAEAYAVPQVFIFAEINIPMERQTSAIPLGRLNNHFRLGEIDGEPALVEMVRQAILKYRENPVVTGLAEKGVRRWMNMQYIANSTGIPVETLFAEVGIPVEGNAYKPLDWLVRESGYEPGVDHLIDILQRVVDQHEASPE